MHAFITHNSIPKYADITKELKPGYSVGGKSLLLLPCTKSNSYYFLCYFFMKILEFYLIFIYLFILYVRWMGILVSLYVSGGQKIT